VRRADRSLETAVSETSAGMASGVGWAKLWEGFLLPDCAQYHSSECARGHAPGVAGTARSRSCWEGWAYDMFVETRLVVSVAWKAKGPEAEAGMPSQRVEWLRLAGGL
jgi:hypothetical protein